MNGPCPCCSGLEYSECCKKFHDGAYPKTALELMRSRYTAYAYHNAEYIIHTTHPKNPNYRGSCKNTVPQKIDDFCASSQGQLAGLGCADETMPLWAGEEARREMAQKGRFYGAHDFCNSLYKLDQEKWKKEINRFSENNQFIKLEILDFIDGDQEAYVTFVAHLIQNNQPKKLIEKSYFEKIGPQWLYRDGVYT